jgi:hypothetical protein
MPTRVIRRSGPVLAAPLEALGAASSTMLFQAPQVSHRPAHFA